MTGLGDEVGVRIIRGREVSEMLHALGPNTVHAALLRADGSFEDLGISPNLFTNAFRDFEADILAAQLGIGDNTATSTTATSLTKTAAGWTVDAYKGKIVVVDNGTNAPVYGNIGTNSATVLTVDQWWNGDDTVGTTPSATAHFLILPGKAPMRFIGLTTDTGAPAAGDTTLTTERTANGLQRALGLYAHTGAATSLTLSKTFTYDGGAGSLVIHKAGLFNVLTNAAGGILGAETALSADATVTANGDAIALTWTVSGLT